MSSKNVLSELGAALLSGEIDVVDCSGSLGPSTAVLQLPEEFPKNTPKVENHKFNEYDEDGPPFAWIWIAFDEHSDTHFDAPHHWMSGRYYQDYCYDNLNIQPVVAPVNVLNFSKETEAHEDFLLIYEDVRSWERANGDIGAGNPDPGLIGDSGYTLARGCVHGYK